MSHPITPHVVSLKIQAFKAHPTPSRKAFAEAAFQACATGIDAEIKDLEARVRRLQETKRSLRTELTIAQKNFQDQTANAR